MDPKVTYRIYKTLSEEKTRVRIIKISIALLFFIFIPIAYFVGNVNVKSVKVNYTEKQFFKKVSVGAMEGYKSSNIFASVTMAQAMIESGTGSSVLTTKANNLFGIKGYNWTGKTVSMPTNEEVQGRTISTVADFRAYNSWDASIEDHTDFLTENKTYAQHGVFKAKTYSEQAQALQNAGYATDSGYSRLLVTIIKEYGLYKYDKK